LTRTRIELDIVVADLEKRVENLELPKPVSIAPSKLDSAVADLAKRVEKLENPVKIASSKKRR